MTTERRYAKAINVLPAPLARKLTRFVPRRIWIPHPRRRKLKTTGDLARNRRIRELARRGQTARAIAQKIGLCPERIRQILTLRPKRPSPRSTGSSRKTSPSARRSSIPSMPVTLA